MLRLESETGWWLVTHVDHAHLAGAFAERWGNALFQAPRPRARVLRAIWRHDDGWATRDLRPTTTRDGKPSAFSRELVGRYSAFEEIDLRDYLAVRDRAVRLLADQDPYAAILVSMHTINLLADRADRTTILPQDLPLLDRFLDQQRAYQQQLREQLQDDPGIRPEDLSTPRLNDHFRLLQACDNLSLLACVDYQTPAHLLHPLSCGDAQYRPVSVQPAGERVFRLQPYPFDQPLLTFPLAMRHVEGKHFASPHDLAQSLAAAAPHLATVTVCS
ncbi:MAG TPA: DUF3891 family protein [Acidobacteriaceae bacterium]